MVLVEVFQSIVDPQWPGHSGMEGLKGLFFLYFSLRNLLFLQVDSFYALFASLAVCVVNFDLLDVGVMNSKGDTEGEVEDGADEELPPQLGRGVVWPKVG